MNEFSPLLPLFIPSFSSKGNLMILNSKMQYVSDNYSLLKALDIRISKAYLISAYDIYYGLMPQDFSEWPYTEYLFIDSGGYETNESFDLSERNKYNYKVFPWNFHKMNTIYQRITSSSYFKNSNIILSSFDNICSFHDQIISAYQLKKQFHNATIDFIVKINFPISELIQSIRDNYSVLENFLILGFTEKELGCTIQERLLNLISIRHCLNNYGWHGYIHIFGGLEPNLAKLFYYAGADIFDGLSWQRIRYENNSTLYDPNKYIISYDEYDNKLLMMADNLSYMQSLSNMLSTSTDHREIYTAKIQKLLEVKGKNIQSIVQELEVE